MKPITFSYPIHLRGMSIVMMLISFSLLPSCISVKPVEYRKLENFTLSKSSSMTELKMDVIFYNPNGVGAKVKKLNFDITLGKQKVSSFSMDEKTRVKPESEFRMPVTGSVSLAELMKGSSSNLLSFVMGEDLPLIINGEVVIKKFIFSKKLDFEFRENISRSKFKF